MKKLISCMILSCTVILIACNGIEEKADAAVLTEEEIVDLLQLREEEKLARDVYLYTYEKYGLNISQNIGNSEQTHMDRVLQILSEFDLEDPADTAAGVFNDVTLQELYDQLTAKVDLSIADALTVGAAIEDLDIDDIEYFLQRTTKESISNMYENLQCGSRNHLRSYYSRIVADGGSYSPEYISQSQFDAIINSDNETCGQ